MTGDGYARIAYTETVAEANHIANKYSDSFVGRNPDYIEHVHHYESKRWKLFVDSNLIRSEFDKIYPPLP